MRTRLRSARFHLHRAEEVEEDEAGRPRRPRRDAERGVAEMPEAGIMLQQDSLPRRSTKLRGFRA